MGNLGVSNTSKIKYAGIVMNVNSTLLQYITHRIEHLGDDNSPENLQASALLCIKLDHDKLPATFTTIHPTCFSVAGLLGFLEGARATKTRHQRFGDGSGGLAASFATAAKPRKCHLARGSNDDWHDAMRHHAKHSCQAAAPRPKQRWTG